MKLPTIYCESSDAPREWRPCAAVRESECDPSVVIATPPGPDGELHEAHIRRSKLEAGDAIVNRYADGYVAAFAARPRRHSLVWIFLPEPRPPTRGSRTGRRRKPCRSR